MKVPWKSSISILWLFFSNWRKGHGICFRYCHFIGLQIVSHMPLEGPDFHASKVIIAYAERMSNTIIHSLPVVQYEHRHTA